jgi:hypothetical protein
MNPFTPDLSGMSDDELLTKINELYNKMRMVMNNPPVYKQMISIMQDYQQEQQNRAFKRKEDLDNSELSKKIDIRK